jgi:hypothetical protein
MVWHSENESGMICGFTEFGAVPADRERKAWPRLTQ